MELQPEPLAEEIKLLRRCINDLISVLALPAMWSGGGPSQIARTLLDVIRDMLRLDWVSLQLGDRAGGAAVEAGGATQPEALTLGDEEIGATLNRSLGADPKEWPPSFRQRVGDTDFSFLVLRMGLQGEVGVIVAGSRRPDFPSQSETLLLSVAVNQAVIGLQGARILSEQKEVAADLDRRVALRTTELAAANAELLLRAGLLQHIPVAAWTLSPDGTPDFVNRTWLKYAGQTLEYIQSNPEAWMTAIHGDDRESASRHYWDGIVSGQGFTMEARFRRAHDGAYRWHLNRAVALRDSEGEVLKFVGTSTDIEDLKLASQQLRESELNLRQMTETIPEMLWSATAEGAIDYCNARVLDYTGFPAEKIMGDGWEQLLHPDDVDQATREWASCVRTGTVYRVEVRTFNAADRSYRWCVTKALPLRDHQGRILRWHGTVVDMHDWKQAQEGLRIAQSELAHMTRVTTLGELTASIAHEVNQPLGSIVNNVNACLNLLEKSLPEFDEMRDALAEITQGADRASAVIARVRQMVSKTPSERTLLKLGDVVADVLSLSRYDTAGRRVSIRVELAEDMPPVAGDRVQLQQVLLNLIVNGMDAMTATEESERVLTIWGRRETRDGESRCLLGVRDCGTGFTQDEMDRLFEAFYTTKPHGMGMGLAISRSIVEAHGGRLWAEANQGAGATFLLSLPDAQSGNS